MPTRGGTPLEAARPGARASALANRAFLRRFVHHGLDRGITQFVELGSGLPTMGHVHHTAHARCPQARVVYVEHEPETVDAGRALLAGNPYAAIVPADLRDPGSVLADPRLRTLIDLGQPVALSLVSVLHLIPDQDDPGAFVTAYLDALAPGGLLALTHLYGATSTAPATWPHLYDRTPEQIADLFGPAVLEPPGLLPVHRRPGADGTPPVPVLAGIGHVPPRSPRGGALDARFPTMALAARPERRDQFTLRGYDRIPVSLRARP